MGKGGKEGFIFRETVTIYKCDTDAFANGLLAIHGPPLCFKVKSTHSTLFETKSFRTFIGFKAIYLDIRSPHCAHVCPLKQPIFLPPPPLSSCFALGPLVTSHASPYWRPKRKKERRGRRIYFWSLASSGMRSCLKKVGMNGNLTFFWRSDGQSRDEIRRVTSPNRF